MPAALQVATEQVNAAAGTVSSVSEQISAMAGLLAMAADAAADTPAAGACRAAAAAWMGTLPQYGDAVSSLAQALTAAAECYRLADRLPVAG
jgi:hypothetical protein